MISDTKLASWLRIAATGAQELSTCSRRQYMAVVLDHYGHVVGLGYNGPPPNMRHCNQGGCERGKSDVAHGSSYDTCTAVHAETNALVRAGAEARGATLVINGPPCWDCAKVIITAGIWKVAFYEDPAYADWPRVEKFLHSGRVKTQAFSRPEAEVTS